VKTPREPNIFRRLQNLDALLGQIRLAKAQASKRKRKSTKEAQSSAYLPNPPTLTDSTVASNLSVVSGESAELRERDAAVRAMFQEIEK